MAKASIKVTEVEKLVKAKEEVRVVTVEMSLDEAKTLHDILRRIGGSHTDSRRKYAETVLDSLEPVLHLEEPVSIYVNNNNYANDFKEPASLYFKDFQ